MSNTDTMIATEVEATLTREDRCESCGAAAMVRIKTEKTGTWLFCGHHADKHLAFLPLVLQVHDERNPLPARREPS